MAFGCGASGRLDGIRYDNTTSLKQYCLKGPCSTYIPEPLSERGMDAIMMAYVQSLDEYKMNGI